MKGLIQATGTVREPRARPIATIQRDRDVLAQMKRCNEFRLEDLAKALSVHRMAAFDSIRRLRAEGHLIMASTGIGYQYRGMRK